MNEPVPLPWPALLDTLAETPNRLRRLLADVPYEKTCERPDEDRWSVCETLAHLCAVEPPYRARLARIVLEDNPYVTAIGSITGDYDPATPVVILLDTLARMREDTVAFLRQLPPEARVRSAVHAELGPITLRSQVESLLAHDQEHLAQIEALIRSTRHASRSTH